MHNSAALRVRGPVATPTSSEPLLPPASSFPALGPLICILILAVVAVRLQELIPLIAKIKPVLLVAIGGFAYLLSQSTPQVTRAMLRERQTRLVLAYYGFCLFTIPFALYSGLAVRSARGMLPAVILFLAFMMVPPTRQVLNRVQVTFVALIFVYAAYTKMLGRVWNSRLLSAGGMYDSNDMATLMAIGFLLAGGILLRASGGRNRALAALATVVTLLVVIGSGSRGGALALLGGAIAFGLGMKGERGFVGLVALVGGLILAWNTASEDFRSRMMSLQNLENDYNYTHDTGRKAVWERARGYIKANPVLGVGMGNFPIAEGGAWAEMDRRGKWSQAHNAYLQAWAELGVVGGSLFVLILLSAARQALPFWRPRPRGRGPPQEHRPEFMASLASFAVGGYFLSHAYFPPLFGLLGLIALADRVRRAEAEADQSPAPALAPRLRGQRGGLVRGPLAPAARTLRSGA